MADVEKVLIALLVLTIVAVVLSSGQTSTAINAASSLLVSFVKRIDPS